MLDDRKPLPHQEVALEFIANNPRCGVFLEQGLGKTLTSLWAAERAQAKRILIVAPLTLCGIVWQDETQGRGEVFPVYAKRDREAEVKRAIESFADTKILITTYDSFLKLSPLIHKFAPDFTILDEATAIKHVSAKRTRLILKATEDCPRVLLLTGTPLTRSPLDLHGLGRFIIPDIMPKSVHAFKDMVMVKGLGEWDWLPRKNWQQTTVVQELFKRCIFMKLRDAVDLPPIVYQDMRVRLTDAQRSALNDLRLRAQTLEGEVTVAHVSSLRQRVSTICAGFVKKDNGDIIHLKNNRIDLIEELLNESDAPAIVFGWHTELVTHLAKTLNVPCIYGETPQLDRRLIVEQFQEGEIKTIIANPRTIGHGLTLTKASRIIFAQIPDSLEYYLQAVSRMERIGQKQSMVVYHLFSPPEMRLLKSLKYKQALADDLNEFKLILSELKEAVAVQ